jgi:small subunit ribosomal protein S9
MATSAHKPKVKADKFVEGRGGRKTAISRVRVSPGKSGITVNDKSVKEYFKLSKHQDAVNAPFKLLSLDSYVASARVAGGGINAQAEAVRNGIAKALVGLNVDFRPRLKKAGFLTRDPRVVERKKYGLKKARRAPQWAKR